MNFPGEPQSLASFYLSALGVYAILLPLAALVSLAIALIVIVRGRGPLASASLVLAVSLPLLVGMYGTISGALASCRVVSSWDFQLKTAEILEAVSHALVPIQIGMVLMAPIFVLALFGSLWKSLKDKGGTGPA